MDPELYNTYFYVEDCSGEDGNEVVINSLSTNRWGGGLISINLEYSYDQINWIQLPTIQPGERRILLLPKNNRCYLRGKNIHYQHIWISAKYNHSVGGNIMSLICDSDFKEQFELKYSEFTGLFQSDTNTLIYSHNLVLPATTLSAVCYAHMFWGY